MCARISWGLGWGLFLLWCGVFWVWIILLCYVTRTLGWLITFVFVDVYGFVV